VTGFEPVLGVVALPTELSFTKGMGIEPMTHNVAVYKNLLAAYYLLL
jgi:hypothetical protein